MPLTILEMMGDNEFCGLLTEWREWGFNEYADWFDPVNCADPYPSFLYDFGNAQVDAKKRRFGIAQKLGMPCVLVITPNMVFQEQCLPGVQATKSERIFGQLVCPSNAAGREISLRNHENWFRDVADVPLPKGCERHAFIPSGFNTPKLASAWL